LAPADSFVNEQQLTEMNNQQSAARARTASAKARLDQVQQVQLTKNEFGAFPEAVQSQTITALRSQYAEVMRREAEQMTSLGARHPAVIEIQAEAERLRRMVDDEVHRIAISARTEYESARANEETIAANLDKLKNNAMTTNEAMVTLRELERDVQANRAVYEAFLVRARETGAQERLDTKNIRVISQADIPLRRSFPPSNLLVAVGAILFGMAAGGGIVFARETYGSAGDFGRDLRRDSGRDFVRDSEFPRTGGTGVRGRLTNAVRDFLPAGRPSSIPVLAVLPSTDVSFGLSAAENPRSRLSMELYKVHQAVRASHSKRGNLSVLVV
jgi:polysaccharide biosynthesis transport protein